MVFGHCLRNHSPFWGLASCFFTYHYFHLHQKQVKWIHTGLCSLAGQIPLSLKLK